MSRFTKREKTTFTPCEPCLRSKDFKVSEMTKQLLEMAEELEDTGKLTSNMVDTLENIKKAKTAQQNEKIIKLAKDWIKKNTEPHDYFSGGQLMRVMYSDIAEYMLLDLVGTPNHITLETAARAACYDLVEEGYLARVADVSVTNTVHYFVNE